MGRVLGVDLGDVRIGLALSDPTGLVAGPLDVIIRRTPADRAADHAAILAAAVEHEVERIVVGMPLSMSGRAGPKAQATAAEIAELADRAGPDLPIEPYDERLTTVSAQRSLALAGVRASERRGKVDKVAAALMLQAWLDGRRPGSASPGPPTEVPAGGSRHGRGKRR